MWVRLSTIFLLILAVISLSNI
uniref:Uncharacterized protein n=1 Tax=Anguilla anguilla TaxID=7936 RepID=A0A0E9SLP7_ANGAN